MSGRTIAIGDVHGCSKALEKLIEMIAPASDDTIVFLGDYIDRGSDSPGVIELAIALQSRCTVVPLMGNHEIMLLSALAGQDPTIWIQCGGAATLKSYGATLEDIPQSHIDFLQRCRPYYETDSHIFVHASYMPNQEMKDLDEQRMFWDHLGAILPLPHKSGKRVVVGHTPQANHNIMDAGHMVCIDTYCFGGGYLTAFDTETSSVWQADNAGEARDGRTSRNLHKGEASLTKWLRGLIQRSK